MKTCLIYVLSSHSPPYGEMIKTAMATWDAEPLEGTRTVYYCGEPTGGDTDRVISFGVFEDYVTIGHKNLLAYPRALNWEWDYMARVNSSCYVHKRRLLEHVQSLPDFGVIKGIVSDPTITSKVTRQFMWGGGQFIFSRDVVEALVNNAHHWRHDLMEDVATSELAQDCDYRLDATGKFCSINKNGSGFVVLTYNGKPGFEFSDFSEIAKVDDQHFFRCKNDMDRRVDAEWMRLLKQHLTP